MVSGSSSHSGGSGGEVVGEVVIVVVIVVVVILVIVVVASIRLLLSFANLGTFAMYLQKEWDVPRRTEANDPTLRGPMPMWHIFAILVSHDGGGHGGSGGSSSSRGVVCVSS